MIPQISSQPPQLEPSAWLQALSLPLHPLPCGDDPRYLDDFLLIKQEIDKLQGNDYPRVVKLCQELLAVKSRDLRIAGYLLLASVYVDGMSGLLEAARGYQLLLQTCWSDCHPQKPGPRLAALNWINHAKLESYARQHGETASAQQLTELRTIIDGVNTHFAQTLGEQAPRWTVLDKWLQAGLKRSQSQPSPPRAGDPLKAAIASEDLVKDFEAAPAESLSSPLSSQATTLNSERELTHLTRCIRDYLLQNGDYLRAVAYTRSLRWAQLTLPPHQQGATRVPAPRPTALNELNQLLAGGEQLALLLLCEKLFLEPGGHLALDLQRHACNAAQAMGHKELARLICDQTGALLRRLPELAGLRFENGQPLAEPATRQWLDSLNAHQKASATGEQTAAQGSTQLAEQIAAARRLVQSKQLPAALGVLKTCLAENDKQRLLLQLAMARICLEAGRPEVAQPVLDELQATVEEKALHLWDQDLALEVWTLSLENTRALLQRTPAKERSALSETMSELQGRICRIDLEAAARLF